MINCCEIKYKFFISQLVFYIILIILEKFLKYFFKAFYSDQAFWDFLDTVASFWLSVKKIIKESVEFLGIEKEYNKKFQLR